MGGSNSQLLQDPETSASLQRLSDIERLAGNRVPGVRTVLVVLSSFGMGFDVESLRQKILLAYPDATVFFRTTAGKPLGIASFKGVDLLIDFTGPGQRQPWCYARKLRKTARFAVGRNAGFFRKRLYDRIFDERKNAQSIPSDLLERERHVQKEVLALAGIPMVPVSDLTEDRAKTIALDLPPLAQG